MEPGVPLLFLSIFAFVILAVVSAQSNNDGPSWVESVNTCGGLLVGNAGLISYKLGEQYNPGELCTWAIRANRRSKVVITVLANGFELPCAEDGCGDGETFINVSEWERYGFITPFDRLYGYQDPPQCEVQGPIAYVTFRSNAMAENGTGFVLSFLGVGDSSYDAFSFKETYLEGAFGSVTYPYDGQTDFVENEFVSYVINPKIGSGESLYLIMDDIQVNLTDPTTYCTSNQLRLHQNTMASGFITPLVGWCQVSEPTYPSFVVERPGVFVLSSLNSPGSSGVKKFKFSWESFSPEK